MGRPCFTSSAGTRARTLKAVKTVLLVEDDDDIRETYAEVLLSEGYAAEQAENGLVALKKLELFQGTPCLVLLDMMMPEMNGAEFLAVLHETHKLAALPVVLVSASKDFGSVKLGARRFVKKPASLDVLLRIVVEFCGLA